MSRKFILHNNNVEILLIKCSINNQVICPFFILNKFIDFSEFM